MGPISIQFTASKAMHFLFRGDENWNTSSWKMNRMSGLIMLWLIDNLITLLDWHHFVTLVHPWPVLWDPVVILEEASVHEACHANRCHRLPRAENYLWCGTTELVFEVQLICKISDLKRVRSIVGVSLGSMRAPEVNDLLPLDVDAELTAGIWSSRKILWRIYFRF